MQATGQNIEFLHFKLDLHRRLFAFIRISRTEEEVVHFVVSALWQHFHGCQACFFRLGPNGELRMSLALPPMDAEAQGPSLDLNTCPEYMRLLRETKALAFGDLRNEPAIPSHEAEKLIGLAGALSRLDCPVAEADGRIGMLSLAYPEARVWSPQEIDLLEEMAELIRVLGREARAISALKNTEAIFRQFAENIDAVFWMADPENQESIYVSPSYDHIWGVDRGGLKSNARSFLEAVVPEDRDRVTESLKEHQKGPFEKKYRIQRPDGHIRWIRDRSFPVRNDEGRIYRVVGIAEDITPLREAQERLEATQAQVISNAKFAALGEMASGIAHEINNPLAVILGISSQLQERMAQSEGDAFILSQLNTIDKMSKRIAAIIKGLRTFSRQTDLDPMVSSDLLVIIQETLAICESSLQALHAELNTDFPAESLMIRCRPSEISQVLLNLMNNAKDAACRSGRKAIRLSLAKEGAWAVLAIEDSGPGVPADIRERIFQPFFTTKEVGAGTGLGLSISKGIVEAHGGKLYLDSCASGARFIVKLPVEEK